MSSHTHLLNPFWKCSWQNNNERMQLGATRVDPRPFRKQQKKDDFEAFFKRIFKRKITSAKVGKICWQITIATWCSHSNTIYAVQLQKTIVSRMQPRHRTTLTQPLQCDLQRLSCKTQKNYAQRCRKLQLQNRISTPKQKKDDFEAFF